LTINYQDMCIKSTSPLHSGHDFKNKLGINRIKGDLPYA